MDENEDVTIALVGEDGEEGTKFRRKVQQQQQQQRSQTTTTTTASLSHLSLPKKIRYLFCNWICKETDAPCTCLNFTPFSSHTNIYIRLIGWICRIIFPCLNFISIGMFSARLSLFWGVKCQDPIQVYFVVCVILTFVITVVWILFFIEKIPKILRLRLLLFSFLGLLWSAYGFALATRDETIKCNSTTQAAYEITQIVLFNSLILFLSSVFPLILAIVGFYIAIIFMLCGAVVSSVWAGVMTIATAACCCPCARRTCGERLSEPLHCTWFGSCGRDCTPEFGFRTDMPCSLLNFAPLASYTDLWSWVGTWSLRGVFLASWICVVSYLGYEVHKDWGSQCNSGSTLKAVFIVSAVLYFVVLLGWELFFVERITKVRRMWSLAAAALGLAWGSYGISIAQSVIDNPSCHAANNLPLFTLAISVALLLSSLLPVIGIIACLYSVIVICLAVFLVSVIWGGLMSIFTAACCCPCARRTMLERMQEPMSCEWFGHCGRDCTPVYGNRLDAVPCACLDFPSLAAMTNKFLFVDPRIPAWIVRTLVVGACVSLVSYLSLWVVEQCKREEKLIFGLSAALYILVLLGWQLFVVEKVPKVLRLWVIVLALLGIAWGSYGIQMSSPSVFDPLQDDHFVTPSPTPFASTHCMEAGFAQSIALLLASLFPLIFLIVGFYILIVLGLFGFLFSVCYAAICVCLSHCCPITLAAKRSFVRRVKEPLKCQWFNRCCGICPPDETTRAELTQAANAAAARQAKLDKTAGLVAFLLPSIRRIPHPDCPLRNFYTSPEWDRNLSTLVRDFLD